jgi:glutamyl-tRNA synthetase
LPSLFELVGFVYSVWFIYRYLLLANTRKELIDGITAWKSKVFG